MSNCVFMSRVWVLSNQTRRRGETSKTNKKLNLVRERHITGIVYDHALSHILISNMHQIQ